MRSPRSALQVSAKRNMTPLHKALHRAKRTVTSYKLNGLNHLFQPPPPEWPMVNGVQQPAFSPEALKLIHSWVALETKVPGGPLPVTVKRPPSAPKPGRTPSTTKARG